MEAKEQERLLKLKKGRGEYAQHFVIKKARGQLEGLGVAVLEYDNRLVGDGSTVPDMVG